MFQRNGFLIIMMICKEKIIITIVSRILEKKPQLQSGRGMVSGLSVCIA